MYNLEHDREMTEHLLYMFANLTTRQMLTVIDFYISIDEYDMSKDDYGDTYIAITTNRTITINLSKLDK